MLMLKSIVNVDVDGLLLSMKMSMSIVSMKMLMSTVVNDNVYADVVGQC